MLRVAGLCAFLTFLGISGFAQDNFDDEETRLSTHYVGIQANQLLRQLLSLGNPTAAINNPYLMTYSVNSNQTGVGLNIGFGYTFNEFKDRDGTFDRETKINDLSFRIGVEKKTILGKKWILSAGMDVVIEKQSNHTESTFIGGGGGGATPIETDNNVSGWGTGPRVGLNFKLSEKILLGTEANYYFKSLSTTSETKGSGITPDKDTFNSKKFQLNVPAVIFLVLKF